MDRDFWNDAYMESHQFLEVYDNLRRQIVLYGFDREEVEAVVRHLSPSGDGVIVFSNLTEGTADSAIRTQVEDFQRRGGSLEWMVYAHDQPADMGERLVRHGFVPEGTETILMLDLSQPAPAPKLSGGGRDIRRAITTAELEAVAAIRQQTWGGDAAAIRQRLTQRLKDTTNALSVYVAYVESVPVSTGQITFYPEFQLASLGSAATLPAYRRQGLYASLLLARLHEARQRDVRFIDTEASPMSRPILEKYGFQPVSKITAYSWQPDQ